MLPDLKSLRTELNTRAFRFDLSIQVPPDGRLDSEIVIIGEGPGTQEVMQKLPLVGPSGAFIWNALRKFHILRPQCYITNVSKQQVSLSGKNKDALLPDDWLKWQNLLHWELSQLTRPRYILALGNAALQALHGWKGITNFRGSVYDYTVNREDGRTTDAQVLYSFNPAAVMRTMKDEIIFSFDMRRFSQLIRGDWKPYPVSTEYNLSFDAALDTIRRMKAENKPTAVDIETTSGATACVGLANDPHNAVCINFRDLLSNRYTVEEEIEIFKALQDLYQTLHRNYLNTDGEQGGVVAQNGNFDSHFSGFHDHIDMPISYDTLLAHHTLYPQLPHDLGFLTSMYSTHPYYKAEIGEWKETGDITTLWDYNGKDAAITHNVFLETRAELKQQNLWPFFNNHVMKLQPHLITSTIEGTAVDLEVRNKVAAQIGADVDAKLDHFHYVVAVALDLDPETTLYKPNPNSPLQIKDLLYNKLNLKHRSNSTDENARNAMLEDTRTSSVAKEVLVALNSYKIDQKFFSTYANARVDSDNRFRCDWKQYGVQSAPGRLSSAKTLWQTGMNLQNQPPKARQFYVADDDCVLIYFDLSQAEARVVGFAADIDKWKEDFERARLTGDFDCHRSLAAEMFKLPYDSVPKKDRNADDTEYTIRYIAKRCRHGLNYRMQIARLAETTGLPLSRAAQSYHAYHKINPEIEKWWQETEAIVRREHQLFNAFGRRWKVLQRIDDNVLKSIVAFYPQSTIGDKVSQVWYQAQNDPRWDHNKARIRINVHDSLTGVATKAYAKTALSIMKAYAETPILIQNVYRTKTEELIIPADTAISTLEIRNRDGEVIGFDTKHRWSNLEKQDIVAAKL